MRTITINVTQEDIDNGEVGNPKSCPVALAVKKVVKADLILVDSIYLTLLWDSKRFLFFRKAGAEKTRVLPEKAKRFIRNFDAFGNSDKYVKPFSFEIEI